MADAKVVFEGWDSSTQGWGLGGWGQDVDIASATSSVGTVTVGAVTLVNVPGLQVDATAGNTTESAGGGISVGVTGTSVTASTSGASIWSAVITSQTPSWSEISTSQTPNWTEIAA